jgi:hypothetical protein
LRKTRFVRAPFLLLSVIHEYFHIFERTIPHIPNQTNSVSRAFKKEYKNDYAEAKGTALLPAAADCSTT